MRDDRATDELALTAADPVGARRASERERHRKRWQDPEYRGASRAEYEPKQRQPHLELPDGRFELPGIVIFDDLNDVRRNEAKHAWRDWRAQARAKEVQP